MPHADILVRELENFRVKITASANEVFGVWRDGLHDYLVLATSPAAWWLERRTPSDGPAVIVGATETSRLLDRLFPG